MAGYNIFESSQSLDSLMASTFDDQGGPLMNLRRNGVDPDPTLNRYDGGSQPLANLSDNDLNVNSDLLLEATQFQLSLSQLVDLELLAVDSAGVAPRQDLDVPIPGTSSSKYLPVRDGLVENDVYATTKELYQRIIPDQDVITLKDWEGDYNFRVQPYPTPAVSKKCLYNVEMNKLWANTGVVVPFKVELDYDKIENIGDWIIRASLIFLDNDAINQPVLRCAGDKEKESKMTDEANLVRLAHVLRPGPQDENDFVYLENKSSKRCYLLGNLKGPEPGVDYAVKSFIFACRNSCIPVPTPGSASVSKELGIQFILYDRSGKMQGRRMINLRVCSAPVRDSRKELAVKEAGGVKQKRKSRPSEEENSKRACFGKEEATDVALQPQARSVVTVPKAGREEEEINNSSQESVYSCAESSSKIALRSLVKDIQWCLQQKKSPQSELRDYSGHVFQALRGLQGLTQSARRIAALSSIKEERSGWASTMK